MKPQLFRTLPLALLSFACASTGRSPADQLVDRGDYEAAVVAYQAEEARFPDAPGVLRNHGIALFYAGRRDEAIAKLGQARVLDPADVRTLYFLGRAAEETGQVDLALASYTEYLSRTSREAKVVRAKVQELALRKATEDVTRALEREREIDARAVPENTIAVSEFENSLEDADLEPLRHGLAAVMITDLSQVEALRVLERERLGVLLRELSMGAAPESDRGPATETGFSPLETVRGTQERLAILLRPGTGTAYYSGAADGVKSTAFVDAVKAFQGDHGLDVDGVPGRNTWSALDKAVRELMAESTAEPDARPGAVRVRVDPETAPRIGKLLGARRFVQGTFAPIGDEEIQLGASLVEVTRGTLSPAGEPVAGPLPSVLRLEKQLVYQVLAALGIEPTPEERERIDTLPTESFLAFLAYSRGLYLEDLGRSQEALDAYLEAVRADPGFEAAQDREAVLSSSTDGEIRFDRSVVRESLGPASLDTADRLLRTGSWNGIGPGPATDRTDEADPRITDGETVGSEAIIIIEGDLPGGSR